MSKILLVDSYDSYTYNLYQLILDYSPESQIVVVRNDQFDATYLPEILPYFDFVIIGPGPGDPRNPEDVGFLLSLFDYDVPILGVCLGFQLLCLKYGGVIERLQTVKHGQISTLLMVECELYPSGEPFSVTRYHSIGASISGCLELREVAWVHDAEDNGHVSMSAIHKSQPFVGVQYHPESACSQKGLELVEGFVQLANRWNQQNRTIKRDPFPKSLTDKNVKPRPLVMPCIPTVLRSREAVEWQRLDFMLPGCRVAELLDVRSVSHFIFLDAAAEPSRYSILAQVAASDKRLAYHVGQNYATYDDKRIELTDRTVFQLIGEIMQRECIQTGPRESPFWGGLVGYIDYEAGVESLEVRTTTNKELAPDINMIFITRSIVLDHKNNNMYIQSIRRSTGEKPHGDLEWLNDTREILSRELRTPPTTPPIKPFQATVEVTYPDKEQYIAQVVQAQQYLSEGQSYELCLTGRTKIRCERQPSWDLYQLLRTRNPSPFASYIKLPGMQLLSSSPERFLSWSRGGQCELRPIKGTVRKTPDMTHKRATEILQDPKELAENLMIVDLIRHDLHQVAENVQVPSLMQVEEYHTVFQLVSVITGQVRIPYTGFDVLSRSLPPGSMTGAPKKRSVELLQGLEERQRGIYSGVCGYLSVCGGGDWSVIIRSAVRYEAENDKSSLSDVWSIGAGGAITALSDPECEWAEMMTKLQSTLPCFGTDIVQSHLSKRDLTHH